MADKYTIKVQPQVDRSDAKKMERDLNRRFANVSKKFGRNMGRSMKRAGKIGLAGLATAAAGIFGAILTNPFNKINDDLNKTLEKFDNTATRATQFGVSSGKYFEAEQILASAGVDNFDAVLARFSTTLAKARPRDDGTTEDPYLREFLGADNDLDAFYAFAKRISQLDPSERNNAAETVFGEKIGLKIAEVLQTDLSQRRQEIFGSTTAQQLSGKINKLGEVEGQQSIMRAKLALEDLNKKSQFITSQTLKNQNKIEREQLKQQVTQLSQYEVFAKLSLAQERMATSVEGIRSDLTGVVAPIVDKGAEYSKKIFDWISSTGKSAAGKARKIFD